ncbi:protein TsetseEP isoform X6 [Drosophila innubila]|uniref:protein TsetseEP isoform X6 n=1 Tax=Drosophila innubila TaxID=198719 RepID=UPI00148B5387|nr:protein TsetseEP isoform X6 [Drosophila innubila]
MYSKVCVLLLAIGLSQAVPQIHLPDVGLMNFMIQSRDISQDNPTRSLSCFDYYLPLLSEVAETYKTDYAKCLDVAEASRQQINDNTEDDRTQINQSATDACKLLETCSKEENSIPYFDCYTNAGSQNTKTMFEISANSAELLAQVRELYRNIDVDQYMCTNKSERAYVENTSNVYEELNLCVSGKAPVPKPTPEPTTEDDSQKENFPEEDLSRAALEQNNLKSMMADIQKWLKRH